MWIVSKIHKMKSPRIAKNDSYSKLKRSLSEQRLIEALEIKILVSLLEV